MFANKILTPRYFFQRRKRLFSSIRRVPRGPASLMGGRAESNEAWKQTALKKPLIFREWVCLADC